MPRPLVQTAIALIKRRGRYLICRRHRGGFLGGYWELPGGKQEPGESIERCLRREIKEELGVRLAGLRKLRSLTYRYPSDHFRMHVFQCRLPAGSRPKPLAASELRWVPARRLHRFRFPPANLPLLLALNRPLSRRKPSGIIRAHRRKYP